MKDEFGLLTTSDQIGLTLGSVGHLKPGPGVVGSVTPPRPRSGDKRGIQLPTLFQTSLFFQMKMLISTWFLKVVSRARS